MDNSDLLQLEGSVSKLLKQFQKLKNENRQLKADKDNLIEKNKTASNKIEAMISKLKEIS